MPDLLLELFSEEIPARMQRQAAEDLKRLITNALVDRNLTYEGAQAFVTPRRLALHVVGLPAAQPTLREERKGPRVGAPEAAIQGFLKSAGLARIEDATIEKDPKKGDVLRRGDREAGPPDRRGGGRDRARRRARLPLAEVDALGQGLDEARRAALGAPVARNPLHARHPARRGRSRALRRRRDRVRTTSPGAIASWRPSRSTSAATTTMSTRS